MSNTGLIVKGIAGFYYVKSGDAVYRCKARGVFKKQGIKPAVGDGVEFEIIEGNDDNLITKILPRKNSFIRPFLANVDCFVIVTAAISPAPAVTAIDRFMVVAEKAETEIILCINKCDLAKGESKTAGAARENIAKLKEIYENLYPIVFANAEAGEGIDEIRKLIAGKTAALAGTSGVGKSTIINKMVLDAEMEVGSISDKLERGKNTTRHSQLFEVDGNKTMLFDTPGFSSFEVLDVTEEELGKLYPEIEKHIGGCRYDNCRHMQEPGCAVKEALKNGEIHISRYESYLRQMEEIKNSNNY